MQELFRRRERDVEDFFLQKVVQLVVEFFRLGQHRRSDWNQGVLLV